MGAENFNFDLKFSQNVGAGIQHQISHFWTTIFRQPNNKDLPRRQ